LAARNWAEAYHRWRIRPATATTFLRVASSSSYGQIQQTSPGRLCPIRPPPKAPPPPRMPPPPPLSAAAAIATASSCCSTRRRSSTPSTAARSSQSQQHARRWWGLVVFPWGRRRWWPKPLRDGLAAPQLLLPHRTARRHNLVHGMAAARASRGPGRQVRRHDLARGGGVEVDGDRADAGDRFASGLAVGVVHKNYCLLSSLFTEGRFHLPLQNASWLLETVVLCRNLLSSITVESMLHSHMCSSSSSNPSGLMDSWYM
jgi:hypothetical protein